MLESATAKNDLPLETSIPHGAVSLESILCTEELRRRPWRPPNYEKENRALVALADSSVARATPHSIPGRLAASACDFKDQFVHVQAHQHQGTISRIPCRVALSFSKRRRRSPYSPVMERSVDRNSAYFDRRR
jgi:hypothetical protein